MLFRSGASCVGLMSFLAVETWLRFLVWLIVGLLIYVFYGRRHSVLGREGVDSAFDAEGA